MNDTDETYYRELSQRAERGQIGSGKPSPNAKYGADAVAEGQRVLMWATGTDTIEEALAVARRGRPSLSAGAGESPIVRARLPIDDYRRLETLSDTTGRSQSDLIREGVRLVLAAEAA